MGSVGRGGRPAASASTKAASSTWWTRDCAFATAVASDARLQAAPVERNIKADAGNMVVLARSAERPRRSVVSRIADRGQADLTQPALGICSVHIDKTKAHKNRIENCWPQQQCVSAMSLNFSVVDDRVNRESD
ncbi:hypothetical protein PC112_g17129 [Phytophthora cactorum]|nr:hypothetical protein PC112_g17129 [Phytophthora cactorum]